MHFSCTLTQFYRFVMRFQKCYTCNYLCTLWYLNIDIIKYECSFSLGQHASILLKTFTENTASGLFILMRFEIMHSFVRNEVCPIRRHYKNEVYDASCSSRLIYSKNILLLTKQNPCMSGKVQEFKNKIEKLRNLGVPYVDTLHTHLSSSKG